MLHPDLTVICEERVLDAILLWGLLADELCGWEEVDTLFKSSRSELLFGDRLESVKVLLPFVRFPLMSAAILEKLSKSNLSNQIPAFGQLVMEAINYKDSGIALPGDNQNVRFQHRRSSFKELQYICDGDNNGVIYFAGTSYGIHQWVNPVLSKKITMTASSPSSRFTDPKALVSRTYQATSFAGPRVEDGKRCSWWMVDIGQDHQDRSLPPSNSFASTLYKGFHTYEDSAFDLIYVKAQPSPRPEAYVQVVHFEAGWVNCIHKIMGYSGGVETRCLVNVEEKRQGS
ncbi:hypothetical protein IFM89_039150 [Coptis chinensis]|uniref:BTB/POZ domain-containing protein n=1 Tax=Coptis chinensis TaxID=261450 RepID=A0A835HQJ3_9MAGN|nr:hypothetical protein IFM89_039150 [Coptis chinensis]